MALPITRNETHVPGVTPVKGALLDDLQDCTIGAKDKNRWLWQIPGRGMLESNVAIDFVPGVSYPLFLGVPEFYMVASADDSLLTFPATQVLPGTRITDVGFTVTGTGVAGAAFASLWRTSAAGSALVGYVDVAAPGALAKYTAAIAPLVVGADETLFWYVGLKKATWRIHQVGFARDRL